MAGLHLPPLPEDFEPTRATLHAYAHAVEAVPRAHGIAHPKWWHISLEVRPEGLVTDPVPLPGGGAVALCMDLRDHDVVVRATGGAEQRIDMRSGATGTEMGERVLAAAAEHGLEGPADRSRFENDDPREYDPAAAGAYHAAFTGAAVAFERHRVGLGERVGPVQVWPHGFDAAFEWFGTRTVMQDGETLPSQINLGFYPGGDPYFYSSPWPFEDSFLDVPLPHGAYWRTEGFRGAVLPYAPLVGDPGSGDKVVAFARAVYEAAAPGLGS